MEAGRGALALGDDDAAPQVPGRYQRHRPEQSLLYQIRSLMSHATATAPRPISLAASATVAR
jgi:hypothetical protein